MAARPPSWMLHELAARNLTNNINRSPKRLKGDSGGRYIQVDKISRNSYNRINGAIQGVPDWGNSSCRYTNIRGLESVEELKTALSIKDRRRLAKSLPSEGGDRFQSLRPQNRTRGQRKRERRFMEMEICLDLQSEISQGLINANSIWGGGGSISEAPNALESEPGRSKNTEYF